MASGVALADRASRALTLKAVAARSLLKVVVSLQGKHWPNPRWAPDPVGFGHFVLGVELWDFQVELLEAIRDHRHVACAGGRKIGKDFAIAVAALWWYASFPRAGVFLLAPSYEQLDGIAYLEIRQLMDGSGRCVDCKKNDPEGPVPCAHSAVLTGEVGMQARTGIKGIGFRRIWGKTARKGGALRGFSGRKILGIEDEASDIDDELNASLEGNLAAEGCHRVLISNPTKDHGFFHRAFHEERNLYHLIQRSTEDNPNVKEDREVFPGLAGRDWLADRELAWGRDSPLWLANVEGKFPKSAAGALFSLDVIKALCSDGRRAEADATGRLQIGIDPAGDENDGDESAIAVRRGMRSLYLEARRGVSREALLDWLLEVLERFHEPEDDGDEQKPLVVVDQAGHIGAGRFDTLRAYVSRNPETARKFRLMAFQGGHLPPKGRMRETYRLNRDLLFAGFLQWCKREAYVLPDLKLQAEMLALKWRAIEGGRSELEPKDEIKVRLGRSPDRLDAVALSTWRPVGWSKAETMADAPAASSASPPRAQAQPSTERPEIDPYRSIDSWRRGG